MKAVRILGVALLGGAVGLATTLGAQQSPAAGGAQPDPAAALKQSIGEGTKRLAQYEWVETTIITLKGEEKGRKLNRCYLDKPDEPVTLVVQMNTLPNGALYSAQTTLDAKAKNIEVVITNSGHKPVAR